MENVQLCSWSVSLAALGYWADVIASSHATQPLTPAALGASIFSAGAVNAATWVLGFSRLVAPAPRRAAPATLAVPIFASAVLCVLPIGIALAPGLILLGGALLLHADLPASRREAGLLVLGLGVGWGWPFLRVAHAAVGSLDARAVGAILGLSGLDVRVQGNIVAHGNFAIEILPACASSSPLAEVALAYAVVALYCRHRLSKADLPWLIASLLYSIMLTEIRLSLMVPSWADWNWWHNGPGVTIYELVALAGAGLFPWLASRPQRALKALLA
jgi:hypothetical protein